MTSDAHDRWLEDVAAYMLGALDPEEATKLEDHVEGCERCRSEIRWLTAAVVALPEAVPRQEPPPRLRERLMAEVRADAAAASAAAGEPLPERRGRLGGLFSAGGVNWKPLAGLAVVILAIAAVAGYEVGNGNGGSGAGSVATVVTPQPSGIVAKVVSAEERGEIHLTNVKSLPEDRVLEAWVRRDGEVEPVKALFVPDRDGDASTKLGSMRGVDLVMVTTEPAGGSQSPTSAPIVEVPIPKT